MTDLERNDALGSTPCATCGAPLAGDQRFCLHCGTRRPEARLEFLDVLEHDARQAAAPPAFVRLPPAAPEPPRRGFGTPQQLNLGLLLVATLAVGLLVGHWATDRSAAPAAAAPAPQVIRLDGAAPATAATAAPASTKKAAVSRKAARKRAKRSARTTVAAPRGAANVKNLTKKKIDSLAKKGKPISTGGGKLPPKDNKAPGGGSTFQEIG